MQASAVLAWLWGPYSRTGWWIALFTFAIDQAHKWWMLLIYRITEKGRVKLLPFLDLIFQKNQGISYGMFTQTDPRGQYLLAGFAALATLGLAIWLARYIDNRILAVSAGLIMGGALGNALDRLLVGGVIDYIQPHAFGFYWYVFNIADCAIVAGVVGLLYDAFIVSRDTAAKSP